MVLPQEVESTCTATALPELGIQVAVGVRAAVEIVARCAARPGIAGIPAVACTAQLVQSVRLLEPHQGMGLVCIGGIIKVHRLIDVPDQQAAASQPGIVECLLAVLDQEELARSGVRPE